MFKNVLSFIDEETEVFILDQYRERNRKFSEVERFLFVLGLGLQPIFHFSILNASPNRQNAKNKDVNRHLRLK